MNDFTFDRNAFLHALDAHSIVSVADVKGDILYVNEALLHGSAHV